MTRRQFRATAKRSDGFEKLLKIESRFSLVLVCGREYHGRINFMR